MAQIIQILLLHVAMKFTVFILWHFVKFSWRYDGERFCAAKHDGAGQEIIYKWDYCLLDTAQIKVHEYKQGGQIF